MKINMKTLAILLVIVAVIFLLYKKRPFSVTSDELHKKIPPEMEPKDVVEKVKSGELPADYKTIHDYVEKRKELILRGIGTHDFKSL